MKLNEITLEQLKNYAPELVDEIKNEADPNEEMDGLRDALEAKKVEADELTEKVTTLTTENDELKVKVDEFEAVQALKEKEGKIEELILEAEIATELVTPVFMEQLMKLDDDEKIKLYIEDRKSLPKTESKGEVKDSGDEFIEDKTDGITDDDEAEVYESLGIDE